MPPGAGRYGQLQRARRVVSAGCFERTAFPAPHRWKTARAAALHAQSGARDSFGRLGSVRQLREAVGAAICRAWLRVRRAAAADVTGGQPLECGLPAAACDIHQLASFHSRLAHPAGRLHRRATAGRLLPLHIRLAPHDVVAGRVRGHPVPRARILRDGAPRAAAGHRRAARHQAVPRAAGGAVDTGAHGDLPGDQAPGAPEAPQHRAVPLLVCGAWRHAHRDGEWGWARWLVRVPPTGNHW